MSSAEKTQSPIHGSSSSDRQASWARNFISSRTPVHAFHIDRFWFRNSILACTLMRKERTTLRRSLLPVTMDREEIFPITRTRRIEDAFTVYAVIHPRR